MNNLNYFQTSPFGEALRTFFAELSIPVNEITLAGTAAVNVLKKEHYKEQNEAHLLINKVYPYATVSPMAFESIAENLTADTIPDKYNGLLLFGVELHSRAGGQLPSRTHLAEITRAFNRRYQTPVTIIFKYSSYIAFANSERTNYEQTWREGEKVGKVSLLINIDCRENKTHQGHKRILQSLSVGAIKEYDRTNKVEGFEDLYRGWQKVFSTNILNKEFYKEYQQLSVKLIRAIYPSKINDKLKAHQGALNLLNRMMFVYFIQKKNWLMNDPEFIYHFWQDYKSSNSPANTFHRLWLNKIFFKAFNAKAFSDAEIYKTLPSKYHIAILDFPYLNGGLFSPTKEDDFLLDDSYFESIFEFLQGYIFTISENSADEINMEINPELLGKMYEGMINATDLNDVDAENGIVYTERPEINFMTRRSMVEVLNKKLSNEFSRDFLYHFCFDKPAERVSLLQHYKVNIAILREAVLSVTSLDPTCGSGSMLIGMIQLQVELVRSIDEFDGKLHTPKIDFYLKKQIISECIYGVDIKEWAVRIAELRFWLYMISEAEFSTEELKAKPLLPNLDFKLRQGNSLIQEIGSLDFSIKGLFKGRKRNAGATRKLNEFIKKKKDFITNQGESTITYNQLKAEELSVFREFITELRIENLQQIANIRKGDGQYAMFDVADIAKPKNEEQIKRIEDENEQFAKILATIKSTGRLPFSYDIDFMEIFLTNEDAGFDLIIGNPPYVRQEDILPADDAIELERLLIPANKDEKAKVNKAYKEKLSKKIYDTYPFLGTKVKTKIDGKSKTINVYGDKVPGRSDLYVYFQLLMPSMLNSKGTFCFIISNSWLDVEYGGFVQQFLLKHTQLYAIYDCNVRSFSASVNTIIYLHSSIKNDKLTETQYKTLLPDGEPVKFIMNKADYADTAYAPLLIEQEHTLNNSFKNHYRIINKTPIDLWNEGFDEVDKAFDGDKWGGKWLFSPEIYFLVKEKGYLISTKVKNLISYSQRNSLEAFEYFEKTTQSKNVNIPYLDSSKIASKMYHHPSEIKHFIDGETAVYKSDLKTYKIPDVISNRFIGDRLFFIEGDNFVVGDTFFIAEFKDKQYKNLYLAVLNSTLTFLNVLITGRKNMGDGVLLFYGPEFRNLELFIPKNKIELIIQKYNVLRQREVNILTVELGFDITRPIRDQEPNPLEDRKELDDIIFDELGLTADERKEVYWATAELVKQRLDKAGSR